MVLYTRPVRSMISLVLFPMCNSFLVWHWSITHGFQSNTDLSLENLPIDRWLFESVATCSTMTYGASLNDTWDECCQMDRSTLIHYSDITWVSEHYRSLATQMVAKLLVFVQADNKENIKVPHYWPFVRDLPLTSGVPWHMCQQSYMESVSICAS